MRKKFLYIALALYLILSISACVSSSENITPEQPSEEFTKQPTSGSESYPVSTPLPEMQKTSYPISEDNDDNEEQALPTSEPLVIPEVDPGSGIVHGQVYSFTTNEPLINSRIYLAEKVPLEPGPGYTIAFQERTSPSAQTNERGEFLIEDVEPGEYIPIMVTPFGIYPLANAETDEIQLIIEAGQIYDLENTSVNWP